MEAGPVIIRDLLCFLVVVLLMIWGWRVLNWAWLTPKRLERCLRQQGLRGTPYRSPFGDIKQMFGLSTQTRAKPMALSDDIEPYVTPFFHQLVDKYGKDSFMWIGPSPRVKIVEPEKIREIFTKFTDFQKVHNNPLVNLLVSGLANLEGDHWSKHRKIINPAFHQDKLKNMLPAFYQSCSEMISKWENMVSTEGCSEIDVWPYLVNMTRDVISRAAFGSSFEEGRRLFELLDDQLNLLIKIMQSVYIPGWRFLPTKTNRELKMKYNDIKETLAEMIKRRERAIKAGEKSNDDLLDILVESNIREIEANADRKNMGMNIDDVIEECKLFYFAGQETTSVLLVWTMILLARYPDWQTKARDEVLHVFGGNKPDADGLNRLKVVTMILYEVLRLYPAVVELVRSVPKELKLGKLLLPAGTEVSIPMLQIHHDKELWGDDAHEFKPERFAEGVSKATKSQVTFIPFGWGPRICIGQNFAMMEAKMALAMILKRFWFELSPSYAHSPYNFVTLRPQHGAQIILHQLGSG
ncbi:cytochrome P450, family 72, subfamily A, polypeptide 15 [Hibiscus trionum]|uniref:Cytochrome P450, family 72, subfamily A, polypeptide 15 n=1 Tax=Hibiscus trionum TaxID=183268 RepID=A0A9W7IZF3_HIBTR|nr:cytochrome P450, family 72, subfamily A, polypeptide 15 [Hibiscus trionum]